MEKSKYGPPTRTGGRRGAHKQLDEAVVGRRVAVLPGGRPVQVEELSPVGHGERLPAVTSVEEKWKESHPEDGLLSFF